MQDEDRLVPAHRPSSVVRSTELRSIKIAEAEQVLPEVSLKSHISCSISVEDTSRISNPELQPNCLPTFRDCWLYRGHGLTLNIYVSNKGGLVGGTSPHELLGRLAPSLTEAEIWSKLRLEVCLQDLSSTKLSVSLRHSTAQEQKDDLKKRRSPHYLPTAHPPLGIPATPLHSIDVQIDLSTTPTLRQNSIYQVSSEADKAGSYRLTNSEVEGSLPRILPEHSNPNVPDSGIVHSETGCSAALDTKVLREVPGWIILSHAHPPRLGEPLAESDLAILRRQRNSNSSVAALREPLEPSSCRRLVNSALLSCFFGITDSERASIKTQFISNGPKLVEVAPSLFSPGYLEAIRQRNTFIPTIIRCMTSVMKRSKSPERFASAPSSSVIAQKLWLLAQRNLYDGNAAKKINSVLADEDAQRGAFKLGPELFDDDQDRTQSAVLEALPKIVDGTGGFHDMLDEGDDYWPLDNEFLDEDNECLFSDFEENDFEELVSEDEMLF